MKNTQEMQKELIELSISWGDAFTNGDHRTANKQNNRIAKIIMRFSKDKIYSEAVLIPLLTHAYPSVRLLASVYALELEIHTQQAEIVLTNIAEDPNIRLIPMMAKINLSNWNKKKNKKQEDEPAD